VKILAEIEKWAFDSAAPKVFWLNGMAGTGKSCIAHSLSQTLDDNQMLGASFFCSRSASQEVRDAGLIIPTIAYKLSQVSPHLRSTMSQAIERKPDVGSLRVLSRQFRLLLVEPIQRAIGTSVKTYKTVIIDGLEECTELGTVAKLIESVIKFAPDIPLKFFISSRDITEVRMAFHHSPAHLLRTLSLHSIERLVVREDIKTYLQYSLSVIGQQNQQPTAWPPADEVDMVLKKADGLFIYAATAVRYIGASNVDFKERLSQMARLKPSKIQTRALDLLYNEVMAQAFSGNQEPREVSSRRETLSAVVFLQVALSMGAITSLLGMESHKARIALGPFHSVIHVPDADNSAVSIFHASFQDFIVDQSRCTTHVLDIFEGHQMLTVKCLRLLNQSLKRNICNLDFNGPFSPSYKPNAIHEGLRYSCLHWASHLVHVLEGASAHTSVDESQYLLVVFANEHLLHWFECLSAVRELGSGVNSLDKACEAISVSTGLLSNKNIY
jgi:nucleoside-triphosphatase THEP1